MPIGPNTLSIIATSTVAVKPVIVEATSYVNSDTLVLEEGILEPDVLNVDTVAWELIDNTWSVNGDGSTAAISRGVVQESRLEVWVDGVQVPMSELVGDISVDRRRDRPIQTWEFGTAVDADLGYGPFGSPVGQLGSPLGKRDITIYAVYRSSSGTTYRYPLITNGRVDNYQGDSSTRAEHLERHVGVDGMGCLSRNLINYVKAPGQKIRRDDAIRTLMTDAGVTDFNLQPMRRTSKPLQYVDADPVSSAQELCEVEGRQIQMGPRGDLRNPKLRNQSTPQWTIRESDLFSFQISGPGDVITEVEISGTERVQGDEGSGCAAITTVFEQSTDTIYAPGVLRWTQDASCVINDVAGVWSDPESALIETRKVIRTEVKRCGVLIAEIVDVWEWLALETWRYTRAPVFTELECRNGVRFLHNGPTPSANGTESAYREPEKWRLVSRVATNHYYDFPGWQGQFNLSVAHQLGNSISAPGLEGGWGKNVTVHPPDHPLTPNQVFTEYRRAGGSNYLGAYLGYVTREYGYLAPTSAIKQRTDPLITWEEEDYLPNVTVRGSGDAANYATSAQVPTFILIRVETKEVFSAEDRNIARERVQTGGYAALRGREWLYGDGSTRRTDQENLIKTAEDQLTYSEVSETSHSLIKIHDNLAFPEQKSVVSEVSEGALPQVDILPFIDEEVVTELDANGGDAVDEDVVLAAIERYGKGEGENSTFSIPVTASSQLLSRHCPHKEAISLPMAEDEKEAEDYGKMMIEESTALTVTMEVALNGIMDETDAVTLYYRPRGLNGKRVDLRSVTHRMSGRREMPTTLLTGRIYLNTA